MDILNELSFRRRTQRNKKIRLSYNEFVAFKEDIFKYGKEVEKSISQFNTNVKTELTYLDENTMRKTKITKVSDIDNIKGRISIDILNFSYHDYLKIIRPVDDAINSLKYDDYCNEILNTVITNMQLKKVKGGYAKKDEDDVIYLTLDGNKDVFIISLEKNQKYIFDKEIAVVESSIMIDDMLFTLPITLNEKIKNAINVNDKKLSFDIDFKKRATLNSQMQKALDIIYKADMEAISQNLISINSVSRKFILLGVSFSINPLLTLPIFIGDKLIENKVNEKEVDKVIAKYKKQLAKIKEDIEKEDDPDKRQDLKLYAGNIDDAISNLETYKSNMFIYDDEDEDGFIDECFEPLLEVLDYIGTINNFELLDEASKINHKIKHSVKKTKRKIKTVDKRTSNKIDDKADTLITDIKKSLTSDKREDIIRNNLPKLSKIIKSGILLGTAAAINPALAVVGALTSIALSKKIKAKERTRILNELKHELEITEEKIKDAEADNDRKKKYQLMRLKNSLQRDIDRIRYNQKI